MKKVARDWKRAADDRGGEGAVAQIDVAARDGHIIKPWLWFLKGWFCEHLLLLADCAAPSCSSSPQLTGMVGEENVGTEGEVTATLSTAPKKMLKEPRPQIYLLCLLQELQLVKLVL